MRTRDRARTDGRSIVISLFCGTAILITTLVLRDQAFDDALIHVRIAQHLVESGRPYFNIGEPVKSTSSCGWVLLLASLQLLSKALGLVDPVGLICVTEALAVGIGVFIYLQLPPVAAGRAFNPIGALSFAACYTALLIDSATAQMETPLAVLVAGIGLLGVSRGSLWGIAALGVAPNLRLELAALSVLSIGAAVAARAVALRPALAVASGAALPFLLFDLVHFGTVVPHTVQAKALVYEMPLWEVWKGISRGVLQGARRVGGILFLVYGVLVMAWFVNWGRVAYRRGVAAAPSDCALVLGLAGLTVTVVYFVSRVLLNSWYAPLYSVPVAVVLFTAALRARRGSWVSPVIVSACVLFTFGQLAVLGRAARAVLVDAGQWERFDEGARVRHYRAIGSFLFERYPRARLLTSEIGGLGYGFHGHIVDAVGLATPGALRYHPMRIPEERNSGGAGAIPTGLVDEVRPELIVTYDVLAEHLLASEVRRDYVSIVCPPFLPSDMARLRRRTVLSNAKLYLLIRKDVIVSGSVPPHCQREG